MPQPILIPERTHEDFGHSLSRLLHIIRQIATSADNTIELDFTHARMLNPFFLGGLLCGIHHFQTKGKTFVLNHYQNPAIRSYLAVIHFPNCLTASIAPTTDFLQQLATYQSKTYIPIIGFPAGSDTASGSVREKILNTVSELLKNQLGLKEAQRQPLSYLLDEMTHNIADHSGASHGYVFAQFYPSSNYLDLVICDSGKGIYRSYEGNPRFQPKNEVEALQYALSGKSTKNRPESKGFGLSTSRSMLVKGLRGRFFLWSGNTAYIETIERVNVLDVPNNCYFQGTYLALRIPTVTPATFNFYDHTE